jgi:urate oxidase
MEQFASGWKRSYYGKGDVIVYRLNRDGAAGEGGSPVFGANVLMLVYGDAFWPTYTTGDNTGLVATDSMKNFIQRETLGFAGSDLEDYCRYLAAKFIGTYPQVEGVQVSATEIPYSGLSAGSAAFTPSGPERATARIELPCPSVSVIQRVLGSTALS